MKEYRSKHVSPWPKSRDVLNIKKLDSLKKPLFANLIEGRSVCIKSICKETGLVEISKGEKYKSFDFSEINTLVESDGKKHNANNFWR